MMEELLCLSKISVAFGTKQVVEDVSFSVKSGEITAIVGESGSGKSTILRTVMGLLGSSGRVTGGEIRFAGKSLLNLSPKERQAINGAKIGMVFQNAGSHFCPIRKVGEQIFESARAHGTKDKEEFLLRAEEFFARIGLTDAKRVLDSYPFELSGGMQQRVGIAAAMLLGPQLLLADEPTSALDVAAQKKVVDEMLAARQEFGTAEIIVTHNIGVARAMADRVLVMKEGRCVEQGTADKVLQHPAQEYTKRLLDAVPRLVR